VPFRTSLTLAAGLLAGCAAGGAGPRAGPANPAWHVATAEGFEVWTDAGGEEAARAAATLVRLQATLDAAFPEQGFASRARVRVVLLAGPDDLAELAGPHVAGFYTRRTAQPTIVADVRRAMADPSVLAHELAHHLVERWLVRAPRWLDEGLAEHLGAAGAPGAPPGTLGQAPRWAAGWRPTPGFVRRAMAWDGRIDPDHPRQEPSEAWALVHFLASEEPRRLGAFLWALEGGAPPDAAFAATFPEWRPEELLGAYRLEVRVRAFLASGRGQVWTFPEVARLRPQVAVRAAPPADVHLLRLELPRRHRLPVEAVRAVLAAALAADPAHPEALRWLAQLDRLEPLPLAARAVEAHPADWRTWRLLAGALPAGERGRDREAALRLAVELGPGRPELLLALARHLADEGRVAEAASPARLAAELAPWDPSAVTGYAAVALELGACPVAWSPASRAAALRAEPALDPERQALARRLRELALQCELPSLAAAARGEVALGAGRP
jgi:hypothetical protein